MPTAKPEPQQSMAIGLSIHVLLCFVKTTLRVDWTCATWQIATVVAKILSNNSWPNVSAMWQLEWSFVMSMLTFWHGSLKTVEVVQGSLAAFRFWMMCLRIYQVIIYCLKVPKSQCVYLIEPWIMRELRYTILLMDFSLAPTRCLAYDNSVHTWLTHCHAANMMLVTERHGIWELRTSCVGWGLWSGQGHHQLKP